MPLPTSRRSSTIRTAAVTVAALLGSLVVTAGCARDVDGVAHPATTAVKILPTADEMTSSVGNPLSTFGFQPFIGGVEILPDGYRTEAEASPIDCVAVTDTAMRVVYEPTAVLEAARQSYFNWDEGVAVSGADAAVVRLARTADAEGTFGDLAKRWQACDGKTVIKHLRGANDSDLVAVISDVAVEGRIVSATVRTREGPYSPTSTYQRALGTRGDAIVEASLGLTSSGLRDTDSHAAANTVKVMLDKVAGVG
jgi:hypothetical protein